MASRVYNTRIRKNVCKTYSPISKPRTVSKKSKKSIKKVIANKQLNEFDALLNECEKHQPFVLNDIDFSINTYVDELDIFINECSKFQPFDYKYVDIKPSNKVYHYDLKNINLDMDNLLSEIQHKRHLEYMNSNKCWSITKIKKVVINDKVWFMCFDENTTFFEQKYNIHSE